MPTGDIHNRIHLTAHARIMHRRNNLCARRDGVLNLFLVHVHGVRPDIHKHRRGSPQYKGIGGRHKGVGGHDHFIPRFYIRKQRRQLRGVGTGSSEQALRRARLFFNPLAALCRKRPVTADFFIVHGLPHILKFFSCKGGYVKVNLHDSIPFPAVFSSAPVSSILPKISS